MMCWNLSSNTNNSSTTEYEYLTKIIDAQTTSGYSVSKKFAPMLLKNYKEGVIMLENAGRKIPELCIDMYMKKLQPSNNWFCLNPIIGKQVASYSDVAKSVVDYKC